MLLKFSYCFNVPQCSFVKCLCGLFTYYYCYYIIINILNIRKNLPADPKPRSSAPDRLLLTFRQGLVPRGLRPQPTPVTAVPQQAGDDGRLAEAHVADDDDAPAGGGVAAAEAGVHLLEEPLPAGEEPIGREAGDLKVEGLQVEGGGERNCGGGEENGKREVGVRVSRERRSDSGATRWFLRGVRTSVVLLAAAPRVLPGHSERRPGGNVPLLLI